MEPYGVGNWCQPVQVVENCDVAFAPASHHELFIDCFERIADGSLDRLMIACPPSAGKSIYTSVQFPLWMLARNPTLNILCASNSEELAQSFSRRRRALADTQQWQALAETRLATDSKSLSFIGTEKGGGIRCVGCGSIVSGFRADILILDDAVASLEQALNTNQMQKLQDWWRSEFRTRLKPGGVEVVIGTRWSVRDLQGVILDAVDKGEESWETIRLAMECDDPDTDPLNREMGEPLWPEFYTPRLREEARRDHYNWATLYQGRRIDESGTWVPNEHIHIVTTSPPPNAVTLLAVDIGLTIGGDPSVFMVARLDTDGNVHVTHVERGHWTPEDSAQRFVNLVRQFQPRAALIDLDNASRVWSKLVEEIARKQSTGIPFRPLRLEV